MKNKIPKDVLIISGVFILRALFFIKEHDAVGSFSSAVLLGTSVLLLRGKESGRKLAIGIATFFAFLSFVLLIDFAIVGDAKTVSEKAGLLWPFLLNLCVMVPIIWDLMQSRVKQFFKPT